MSPASFHIAPPRFCRGRESNPHERFRSRDFKSLASTTFRHPGLVVAVSLGPVEAFGAGNGIRTRDLHLGKVALYQLSYSRL